MTTSSDVGFFGLIAAFIARRRVALSILLFGSMLAYDLSHGVKPRNPLDLSDPVAVGAGALVLVGICLRSWAAGILHKGTELTKVGPYRLIRNPLYAGSFLMMIGFAALLARPATLLVIVGPIMVIYAVTVRSEERLLAERFSKECAGYSTSTPRFIPRLARVNLRAPFEIRQWLRHREYQALGVALLALVGIIIWHLSADQN